MTNHKAEDLYRVLITSKNSNEIYDALLSDCHVVNALDWCVGDRVFTFADREVLSVKSIDHQKDTIELCTVEDRIEIHHYFREEKYKFYTNIDAELRNRDAEIKRLQDCIKLLLEKNHD